MIASGEVRKRIRGAFARPQADVPRWARGIRQQADNCEVACKEIYQFKNMITPLRDSSAVEQSPVKRLVAGSNPAPGAEQSLAKTAEGLFLLAKICA